MRVWQRGRPPREDNSDAGMTLVELLVAMGIFVTVIAVFMGGIVMMTKTTARSAAVSDATSIARNVLNRFDKQVRYSTSINRPGVGSDGSVYVEYLIPSQTDGGTPVCVQWRFNPALHKIDMRSWTNTTSTTPVPSDWVNLATNVRNAATDPPFVFTPASTTQLHQQLVVSLDIGTGTAPGAKVASTYVARNSSTNSVSNDGTKSVCQNGVGRP